MIHSPKIPANTKIILTCLTVLSLSACTSYSNAGGLQTAQTFDAAGYDASRTSIEYTPELEEKIFQRGDIATITVNGFEEFSGVYTVGNDGNIFLGHIGNVYVAGKTLPQVQTNLREQYNACCLVNPNVSIEREGQAFGKIVVDGAVNEAGVYDVEDVIKLSEAIALSGGASDLANREKIMLSRVINGERKVSQINLKAIQLAGANDPLVYPNDVIFVQDSKGRLLYTDFVKTIPIISSIIIASTRP